MLPTHSSASDLNNEPSPSSPAINGSDKGIVARRPTAMKLLPLKTVSEEATDGHASLTVPRITKPLDLGFTNLTYSVKAGILKREDKNILQGVNGDFKSGHLTAIMGPSGAGKSTLLDVLAAYTTKNVFGNITVNGRARDIKRFRRQTAYIMQDHDLQPVLTVMEAMNFSANLKIGSDMSQAKKNIRIKEILEAIALYESRKTRTGKLSGGQKKRLAIALELVNNPPIMFFDEPTSGLDSSTSTQCVSILKQLAQEGRTIICTIHQPSALVFKMFDHLFAIADGQCIYTGDTQNVVPFLAELKLYCPEFYNPSDYLLEISTNDYGTRNPELIAKSQNGLCRTYRNESCDQNTAQIAAINKIEKMMASGLMTPVKAPMIGPATPITGNPIKSTSGLKANSKPKKPGLQIDPSKCCKRDERYPTSFCRQFYILLLRTFLILWRDTSLTAMRISIHLFVAPIIGTLYFGIGNDATHTYNNYKYAFFSIMFLMYTAFSSIILVFPLELPIITREHFNRWYSLKAYYVAMTLADVPVQIACIFLYTLITYLMTSQPLEFFRYGLFMLICLVVSFVAQSIGLVIGSLFSVKNGAIFGPFFICPFLIFSGFFIHLPDAHPIMHWLFHISFLKYALEGASLAIFGYDRPRMECNELFCQYVLPDKFLKSVHMNDANYWIVMLAMFIIFMIFRFAAYYIMLYRLRNKS